jgi:hypothetical protein
MKVESSNRAIMNGQIRRFERWRANASEIGNGLAPAFGNQAASAVK